MSKIAIALLCTLFVLPAYAQPNQGVQGRIFQYFLNKAQGGDPNAEFIVGNLYETGKGVPKDSKEAKKWYERAAAQGNQSAKDKLDGKKHAAEEAAKAKQLAAGEAARKRAEAARLARMKAEMATQARMKAEMAARSRLSAERAARARAEAAQAAALRLAAARVAKAKAQRSIDALPIVLGGNWYHSQNAAQFLPSADTSCLQAGESEIVCFSDRLRREVGGSALTYTVKSTLSDFNHNGDFVVNYIYDVVDISGGGSNAPADDPADSAPAVHLGWQQPGQTLRCQTSNPRTVICRNRNNQTIGFAKR
ncbi:MAG: tetratricopeptide repeat protein [Acidiferrobacterales bacterium]